MISFLPLLRPICGVAVELIHFTGEIGYIRTAKYLCLLMSISKTLQHLESPLRCVSSGSGEIHRKVLSRACTNQFCGICKLLITLDESIIFVNHENYEFLWTDVKPLGTGVHNAMSRYRWLLCTMIQNQLKHALCLIISLYVILSIWVATQLISRNFSNILWSMRDSMHISINRAP